MKHFIFAVTSCFLSLYASAQYDLEKMHDSILAEGKTLYRSEIASWHGTDIFLKNYQGFKADLAGYFSYPDQENTVCVFFSKSKTPEILGSVTFDSSLSAESAKINMETRSLSKLENEYYKLRIQALKDINDDTTIQVYNETSLNVIPVIDNKGKRIYVLTGTQKSGEVIIGNDYLYQYSEANELVSGRKLHKDMHRLRIDVKEADQVGAIHTHLPESGDFISATDICTLMLYQKFTNWESHMVMSAKYCSIWNCKSNSLILTTVDAMEKIAANSEDGKKSKKKKG